jgi:hypothetical protein
LRCIFTTLAVQQVIVGLAPEFESKKNVTFILFPQVTQSSMEQCGLV